MTVENIEQQSPPQGRELAQALKELQGLSFSVIAGGGAAADLAVAGLGADDTIVAGLLVKDPSVATQASVVKLTPSALTNPGIPSAGNARFVEATNVTAGDRVIVVWLNKGAL